MKYFLLVVALLFSGYSYSNTSSNNKSIEHPDTKTNTQYVDAKVDTSSLEKTIRESIQGASEKSNAETDQKSNSDALLTQYTGDLSNYTLWLVIATGVLAVIGIFQSCAIWKQIKLAREEFISTHRPRLIVRNISLDSKEEKTDIIYSVVNAGGSEATVIQSLISVEVIYPRTPIRNLRADGNDVIGREVFDIGETKDFRFPVEDSVASSITLTILADRFPDVRRFTNWDDEPTIHFTGSLIYKDRMGKNRTSVFRRKFSSIGFVKTNDEDHEYAD
jgi:hypothetical protein